MFEIAVIGAGVAGLTCAQKLQQTGRRVVVFDKSQGLGGRLATRRLLALMLIMEFVIFSLKEQPLVS